VLFVGPLGPDETPLFRAIPRVSAEPGGLARASENARHFRHDLLGLVVAAVGE